MFTLEAAILDRIILHCDCNCFFASVEAVLNPSLKNGAFAVCGDPELRHGIVLAKNEKAKRCGVETGEPIWRAKLKCPSLTVVKPTYGKYDEFSKRIFELYCNYTDLVEPFGIDECWLDVSGTTHLFGDGKKIADELRAKIKSEIGVSISAGVSYNKLFAKMGSDYKKPDATTVISRENFKELLFPLKAGELFGVGKKTAERLRGIGIKTIGEVATTDPEILKSFFGKSGILMYEHANGREYSQVKPYYYREDPKSMGNGMTFKRNLLTLEEVRTCVCFICDKVSARLRKHGFLCRGIQVAIRDENMITALKSKRLGSPCDLSFDLVPAALAIIEEALRFDFKPIRAITVTGTELIKATELYEQISFFELDYYLKREKEEQLEKTRDAIRRKYGLDALGRCSVIKNEFGISY